MTPGLQRIFCALFPKPQWVREFEATLEADRIARLRLYEYWDQFTPDSYATMRFRQHDLQVRRTEEAGE